LAADEEKGNFLKRYREEILMSRTELARKAGLSMQTIQHIKRGGSCRLQTKRKIILALGLELSETHKVFGNED
jgi:DNA-binding XRE family transcriptional regulator